MRLVVVEKAGAEQPRENKSRVLDGEERSQNGKGVSYSSCPISKPGFDRMLVQLRLESKNERITDALTVHADISRILHI
jgi:hypothetical protein